MGVLDRIEKKDLRDLLGKGWLTHDGMWFYHAYRDLGIEHANALNKAAIRSLAPVEMERARQLLGIPKGPFETFDELMEFLLAALELTLPDSILSKFRLTSPSKGLVLWEWEAGQCFAYKAIRGLGAIDGYRCGVMYRIECWLEALGVGHTTHPKIEACLMHQTGACRGEIRVSI